MSTPEHYVIRREIARGGMGAILSATDQTLDREVAMKVMLEAGEQDPIARQRFLREALVLARLEHPNIVPIHEMGRDAQGRRFYTMKLVKGRTLQAIISAIKKGDAATIQHYTLDRLLTIYRKVCDAIAFAHHHRIIHRDLKPENVMVGEFGEVLVMDWGLAKHLDDEAHAQTEATQAAGIEGFTELSAAQLAAGESGLTMEGAVMGSPQYMPPEQAEGRLADIGTHSDIYSLGGILYAILTLRHPVEGRQVSEVLSKVISGEITPPTHYNTSRSGGPKLAAGTVADASKVVGLPHCPGGKVPASLSAVTMRAMALRPEDRYAEVPQIVSDVEAYQGGFATSAENAGAWTQFTLLIKRHKVAAIGIAAVLLVGATLGTKAFVEGKRAEKALANLHKAAPSLVAQARALVAELKLDAAVEQLDFALAIDPRNLDYALERANYLQAAQHLREAAEAYRGVLRSGENATASANLALCEKLLAVQGSGALSESALDELRVALVAQHREAEAVPIIAQLGKGKEALLAVLRERLAIWRKLPDWRDDRLSLDWNGNVFLNLGERDKPRIREMPITDLSPLHGLFIENLALGRCPVSDLRPLAGMRLTQFSANNERQLTTLSGLENAPLHGVSIDGSNVADLSALRGCRTLDWITMANTPITDLSPIQNCPLSSLSAANSSIQSLEPLRGMKTLKTITLGNCQAITDVSPLADCPNLRTIELPPRATRIETLRKLPNLYYISFKWDGLNRRPAQTAVEFWKEYDAPKAAEKK